MKIVEELRAIKIYNTHDMLKRFAEQGEDVSCYFIGYGDGRSMQVAGTRVYSPSHQTDSKAHFLNRGCKTFLGPRDESMPLALAWASKKYSIKEWAVDPTDRNGKVPSIVRKRALAAVMTSALKASPL